MALWHNFYYRRCRNSPKATLREFLILLGLPYSKEASGSFCTMLKEFCEKYFDFVKNGVKDFNSFITKMILSRILPYQTLIHRGEIFLSLEFIKQLQSGGVKLIDIYK